MRPTLTESACSAEPRWACSYSGDIAPGVMCKSLTPHELVHLIRVPRRSAAILASAFDEAASCTLGQERDTPGSRQARQGLTGHGLPCAQRHRRSPGGRARPRPEGRRRARLSPQPPGADARPRPEPHPGPDRLEPQEPLLPRHLPGPGSRRPREGVRGRRRQHRLSARAAPEAGQTDGGDGEWPGSRSSSRRGSPRSSSGSGTAGCPSCSTTSGCRPDAARRSAPTTPGARAVSSSTSLGPGPPCIWPSSATTGHSLPCTSASRRSLTRCRDCCGPSARTAVAAGDDSPAGGREAARSCSRPASSPRPSSASTTSWPSA